MNSKYKIEQNTFYNSQNVMSQPFTKHEETYHNARMIQVAPSFIGENFPIIFQKDLPDLMFSTFGDKPHTFVDCEVMVHKVIGVQGKANSKDPILGLYRQSKSFCARSTELQPKYIQDSIKGCTAIIVIYGLPFQFENDEENYDKNIIAQKSPIGFATLKFPNRRVSLSNDTAFSRPKITNMVSSPIYIDVICSPFVAAGLGKRMIDTLEDHEMRVAFNEKMNIYYDGISLKALPSAYSYFISQCGFVRTNGDGNIYPFAHMMEIQSNGKKPWHQFFIPKDLESFKFPSKWSTGYLYNPGGFDVSSKKGFWAHIRPTEIFEDDSDHDGFFCMKPLKAHQKNVRNGGEIKHKQTTSYVMYADHKKAYKVYLDGHKKCIHVLGKHLYLVDIRGKYKHVQ